MIKSIRLSAILMALVMAFAFTGCDGSTMERLWEDGGSNASAPPSVPIPPPLPVPPPVPAPVTYRVSFDANGGTGTMDDISVAEGGDCTVLASAFTEPEVPVGAVNANIPFAGWNTAADGSGTAYAAGDTISAVTAEITLYAQWAKPYFSVSADKKVYFAKGNLQYQASSKTWQFAENQYDFIGNAVGNTTAEASRATQSDWIDLFGWGTTGYQDTRTSSIGSQIYYQPYSVTKISVNYGPSYDSTNKYGLSVDSRSDWGCIESLPGNSSTTKVWRTLSRVEWLYLCRDRTDVTSKEGYATVNGVRGIILLPDVFTDPMKNGGSGAFVPKATTGWTANVYENTGWTAMENAGAVFLPAAGYRSGSSVNFVGSIGNYWSSTPCDSYYTYLLLFGSSSINSMGDDYRDDGCCVRLVVAEN